eukprot:176475-Chlamydomonas_euryale.AAC.2
MLTVHNFLCLLRHMQAYAIGDFGSALHTQLGVNTSMVRLLKEPGSHPKTAMLNGLTHRSGLASLARATACTPPITGLQCVGTPAGHALEADTQQLAAHATAPRTGWHAHATKGPRQSRPATRAPASAPAHPLVTWCRRDRDQENGLTEGSQSAGTASGHYYYDHFVLQWATPSTHQVVTCTTPALSRAAGQLCAALCRPQWDRAAAADQRADALRALRAALCRPLWNAPPRPTGAPLRFARFFRHRQRSARARLPCRRLAGWITKKCISQPPCGPSHVLSQHMAGCSVLGAGLLFLGRG